MIINNAKVFPTLSTKNKMGRGMNGQGPTFKGYNDSKTLICFTLTCFDYMLDGDHARKTLHEDIKVLLF